MDSEMHEVVVRRRRKRKRAAHRYRRGHYRPRPESLILSDHAIVRYLERVLHIHRQIFEQKIVTAGLIETVEQLGDGTYPVKNFRVRVVAKRIVTILAE